MSQKESLLHKTTRALSKGAESIKKSVKKALAVFGGMLKKTLGARGSNVEWIYKELKTRDIPSAAFNPRKDAFIGGMFHFIYDPKGKETLPIWDRFPLVIPIELYSDGFLGLNLHYISPQGRAQLLDALMDNFTKSRTVGGYMKVSYRMLSGIAQSKLYEPCIHRYLTNHIKSPIMSIRSDFWEELIFLPTQQFHKRK